ncbi:unnamed protein product [Alopecurus aequalis]
MNGVVTSFFPPSPAPSPDPPHENTNDDIDLIQAFVVASVVDLSLLHVLGSLRRRSSNSLLQAAVMLVYTQSYALVSYTLGQILSADDNNHRVDEFPVWVVCLLLLLGGADCLTARSLDEVKGWRDVYLSSLIKGVWVVVIVTFLGPRTGYLAPLCPILLIAGFRAYTRVVSLRMVGEEDRLCESVKPIADYMLHEHHLQLDSGERPDPVTMEGYRYVVTGEPTQPKYSVKRSELRQDDTKITTVEQIWRCRGSLLRSERGLRRKDVCLSMALSRMLNRRFVNFPLAEAGLEKTHDFLFRGMLAGDNPHERAFRVIEGELGFVHDMYYTRYHFLYRMGGYFALYLPMAMVIFCSWLATMVNRHHEQHRRDTTAGSAYAGTTMIIMAALAFMEGIQMYLYMAGKGGKQPPGVAGEDRAAVEASASLAIGLSRYCAYLVAFAPSLLPDHRSISASMLGKTIKEARKLLRSARTMKMKCEKLMSADAECDGGGDDDGGTVPLVVLGARLTMQLRDRMRWVCVHMMLELKYK